MIPAGAIKRFQSTLPAREATFRPWSSMTTMAFQSTLPAKEATKRVGAIICDFDPFQSTLPAREATIQLAGAVIQVNISIHASREGSDGGNACACLV